MSKRILICGILMSIASLVLGFVVHGLLLGDQYSRLVGTLMRSPADSRHFFHWMIVAHLLVGFAMTWIYARGAAQIDGVFGQGLRFGIAVALLAAVPLYLIYYAVQPTPASLVIGQIGYDSLRFILLGLLVAYLHPQRNELVSAP